MALATQLVARPFEEALLIACRLRFRVIHGLASTDAGRPTDRLSGWASAPDLVLQGILEGRALPSGEARRPTPPLAKSPESREDAA